LDTVKIERFRRALKASGFQAAVAVSPENTWYLSEAMIDTQKELLERLAVVVWAPDREPIYIVCTNEEVQARKESWIQEVRGYVEYQQSPMQLLADALREVGAASGRVALEKWFLSVAYFEELSRLLPDAEFVDARPLFNQVRAIKTADEIRRLESACGVTDRSIRKAFEAARPGMTEKQVGALLTTELIAGGAQALALQVLAAGVDSESTHQRAREYVLNRGDLMRTDCGGIFDGGYMTDMARTISVGAASQRQRDLYRFMWDEHERLIDMVRPGTACEDIYRSHVESFQRRGWNMLRPHIGHSLGIGPHEFPLVRPGERTTLQPGMCISIEPSHFQPGVGKYHLEDLVLVTEDGPRVLSRTADWSQLFVSGV
jgi:Xaa-Pro aminopeptidase